MTPGYWGEDQTLAVLAEQAAAIGFPIMVKAVMGGCEGSARARQ